MSLPFQLLLAAIGGGGAWKAFEFVMDYAGLRKNAQKGFRDDLLGRVDSLQKRVTRLEEDLERERKARLRAELKNEILARRIQLLVDELNRLREKEGMEPLRAEDFQVKEPFDVEQATDNTPPSDA